MTRKPSRLTLLKNSPATMHLPLDTLKELAKMPEDELYMEIAALRVTAANAFELSNSCTSEKERLRAINTSVRALMAVVRAISRNSSLSSDAPVLQDLWDAIDKANRLDGLDHDL
jgi:hypothetical protein